MKKYFYLLAASGLILLGAGCSAPYAAPSASPAAQPSATTNRPALAVPPGVGKKYSVNIANFAFSPTPAQISQGDKVVWTNQDNAPHRIIGPGFDSGVIGNGQSYSFTFNTAGTYDYVC